LDINRRKAGYRDMSLASCYPISPAKEPKNKKVLYYVT
jgi:hypothetical protein